MPSKQESEFKTFIVEIMQVVGPVTARSMFGGFGLFLDGLMIGLIANQSLYLKFDDVSRKQFEALDLKPFTYIKKDKPMDMSYYEAPESVFDNMEEMRLWGNEAYSAALRSRK